MGTPFYPFRVYGYTNGGEMDFGWGCVYRSVQNVQASLFTDEPVWPIERLTQYIGRKWGAWAEPADFKNMFKTEFPGVVARAFLVGGPSKDWLRYTRQQDYDAAIPLYRFQWKPRASYVVDNGVSAYAVVCVNNQRWFLDPHTATPVAVPLKRQLRGQKGWMVLEVEPVHDLTT